MTTETYTAILPADVAEADLPAMWRDKAEAEGFEPGAPASVVRNAETGEYRVEGPAVNAEPDLPDATDVIILDMVEGVKRYKGFAEDAKAQAAEYRQRAVDYDKSIIEYNAKAASLAALIERVGYDPDTGIPQNVTPD